ncbi:MAG: hypothetical protein E6G56_02010 [Actinobacteria bacterium]|nr:MAG: hypothetical protein E6G56_02010 [Actinomycetota bacterium]
MDFAMERVRKPGSRRLALWLAAWLVGAGVWLALVDLTDLPELLTGAVAAALAATGFEVAREAGHPGIGGRARWLARAWRPLVRAPVDIVVLSALTLSQAVRPVRNRGRFRAIPFGSADESSAHKHGRRALAEALGSFAPNTIVVGVDPEAELILVHQLRPSGGRRSVDVLGLGDPEEPGGPAAAGGGR